MWKQGDTKSFHVATDTILSTYMYMYMQVTILSHHFQLAVGDDFPWIYNYIIIMNRLSSMWYKSP